MYQFPLEKISSNAYYYAFTKFIMLYYTYCEILNEDQQREDKFKGYTQLLRNELERFLQGHCNYEKLDSLRVEMKNQIEYLSNCEECLERYHHALNRLERKFYPLNDSYFTNETFCETLVAFLASASDSTVMNDRFEMILSQIPVRFTKQKFYDMVLEGLQPYLGLERSVLESRLYHLRVPNLMVNQEPLLQDLYHLNFKELTKESFDKSLQDIHLLSDEIEVDFNLYLMFQELVNTLYAMSLTKEYVRDGNPEYDGIFLQASTDIIHGLTKLEELESFLVRLEGVQELYGERYFNFDVPDKMDLEERPDLKVIWSVHQLLSSSLFVDLNQGITFDHQLVDERYLRERIQAYIKESDVGFSKMSRPLVRAVMSKIISQVKLPLTSFDKIYDYLLASFECCESKEEIQTCQELLTTWMRDQNAMV